MSETFSVRLGDEAIERLRRRASLESERPRTLARRYIEEGLRQDEHPLIRFLDGPSGRRAALVGTRLDVWEVVATYRDNDGDVSATAGYLGIPAHLVGAALDYYGAYGEEVEDRIAANERAAAEGHAAWAAARSAGR